MTQRGRRIIAAGLSTVLAFALLATPSHATSGVPGVGSAGGATSLIGVDAGDLLNVVLVGEQSAASTDLANGAPSATETLSPLAVASGTLPALNALTLPSVSTTSTGAPDHKDTAALDLATLPQPAPVLTGQINGAALDSVVNADGASSSLSTTLANLGVLGGVVKVDSASLDLGGTAGTEAATANRSVRLDGITVLDLRALLKAVGLDLNKLPLKTLTDLIDKLGLVQLLNSVTGLKLGSASDLIGMLNAPGTAAAQAAVDAATTGANAAQAAFDAATAALPAALAAANTASATLPGLNADVAAKQALSNAAAAATTLPCLIPASAACTAAQNAAAAALAALATAVGAVNTANATVAAGAAAQTAVNTAQSVLDAAKKVLADALKTLQGLLGSVLDLPKILDGITKTLDLQPLLRIEGIEVGSFADAQDTVGASSATTTASIGKILVGGIDLGGIDLNAALDQVQALAGQVTTQLNDVLGTISPQLANLVKVDLFERATEVSQSGAYVNAVAGITGLVATVTPPDICSLLNDVLSKLPVGGNSLPGVTLPPLPVGDVLSTLSSVVSCNLQVQSVEAAAIVPVPALTTPFTVSAAQADSVASFTSSQQPTNTTTTRPGSNPNNPNNPSTTSTGAPLARTGGNETLTLIAGALLAAAALITRRTLTLARARR